MLELRAPAQAGKLKGFKLIRRPDEHPEILRHFTLYGCTQVDVNSTRYVCLVKLLPEPVSPDVGIDREQIIFIAVNRSAQHHKILLKHERGNIRSERPDIFSVADGFKISDLRELERVPQPDPVTLQEFVVDRELQRNVKRLALESDFSRVGVNRKVGWINHEVGGINPIKPVGESNGGYIGIKNNWLTGSRLIDAVAVKFMLECGCPVARAQPDRKLA